MRKVFKNGNSLAVTVPKTYAHELSIRNGSQVDWKQTDQGLLLVHEEKAKNPTDIDPKVARLIKKLSKQYAGVWQDLAKI